MRRRRRRHAWSPRRRCPSRPGPTVTRASVAGSRVSTYAARVADPRPRHPWARRLSRLTRLAAGGPPGTNGMLPAELSSSGLPSTNDPPKVAPAALGAAADVVSAGTTSGTEAWGRNALSDPLLAYRRVRAVSANVPDTTMSSATVSRQDPLPPSSIGRPSTVRPDTVTDAGDRRRVRGGEDADARDAAPVGAADGRLLVRGDAVGRKRSQGDRVDRAVGTDDPEAEREGRGGLLDGRGHDADRGRLEVVRDPGAGEEQRRRRRRRQPVPGEGVDRDPRPQRDAAEGVRDDGDGGRPALPAWARRRRPA